MNGLEVEVMDSLVKYLEEGYSYSEAKELALKEWDL